MGNPITEKNPLGAGSVAEGHTIKVQVCQLSDAAVDFLQQKAAKGERSGYLRDLIETDLALKKNDSELMTKAQERIVNEIERFLLLGCIDGVTVNLECKELFNFADLEKAITWVLANDDRLVCIKPRTVQRYYTLSFRGDLSLKLNYTDS